MQLQNSKNKTAACQLMLLFSLIHPWLLTSGQLLIINIATHAQ